MDVDDRVAASIDGQVGGSQDRSRSEFRGHASIDTGGGSEGQGWEVLISFDALAWGRRGGFIADMPPEFEFTGRSRLTPSIRTDPVGYVHL